jgi:uncharacterized protein
MNKIENKIQLSEERSPWASIFFLLLFLLAGFFVAQFIGLLILLPFFDFDVEAIQMALSDPLASKSVKIPLFIVQGTVSFIAFIVSPWLYMHMMQRKSIGSLFNKQAAHFTPLLLTVLATLAFMFVNSVFIEWNQSIDFPDFLSEFEHWAQDQEQRRKELTEALTSFDNFGQFLLGIFIMAVLPSVGEELLFRGLLQNQIHRIHRNIHVAIWLTAFLFGLIHFQFYGLVPRMMLGALFGYLYYWSGSLLVPMVAHFVNNGLTLFLLYFYQKEIITYDIEDSEPLSWPMLTVITLAGFAFLWSFKKFFQDKRLKTED